MKKGFFILLAITLVAIMTLPVLADRKGHGRGYGHGTRDRESEYGESRGHDGRDQDRDRNRAEEHHGDRHWHYDYRQPGHHPHGYHTQPHGRHYGNPHMIHGQAYHYDGHWYSWNSWEKYRRLHAANFHQGRYYRESGHLFFRFCDPVGNACFFFSIGR
jgi:hypothetical protein